MDDVMTIYRHWILAEYVDEGTRAELEALAGDEDEIYDRFYRELAFGTGGMRGVIGAGTNRMNVYTVGKVTQGLADYINADLDADMAGTENKRLVESGAKKAVAIAYDTRHMSPEFAEAAALCLNANGIKTYVFDAPRPTPELSFAVRQLGCRAGIVITASHNPPEYNGYKVYWSDGAQITDGLAKGITEAVAAVGGYDAVKSMSPGAALASGLYETVGSEIDDAYVAAVKALVLAHAEIAEQAERLKIVYTPLHGTGNVLVRRVLGELGFKNVYVVKEQELPDGDFPTVTYPNPEDAAAFELALALATEVDADIVLATDPDADRLGVYAKDSDGRYVQFSGNMSGCLIAEYRLARMQERGLIDEKSDIVVSTIVSTKLARAIAAYYGISITETLTGFKYIGEMIRRFEENKGGGAGATCADVARTCAGAGGAGKDAACEGGAASCASGADAARIARDATGGTTDGYGGARGAYRFLFGFEESYGCLPGTYARDKDAVAAVTCLAEAAAYCAAHGETLCDLMRGMYERYGYYREALVSVTLPGAQGESRITEYMQKLRNEAPQEIGGFAVVLKRDYMFEDFSYDEVTSGESLFTPSVTMPKSNVLYYELKNGAWVCVRPSGTEPKIKFYMGVRAATGAEADEILATLKGDKNVFGI